jgi:hypothetical protein
MNEIFITYSGNGPQKLNYDRDTFSRLTLWGYSGFIAGAPQNNSATIHVGFNTERLGITIPTGGDISITMPDNEREDLRNFWISGTSGDGVWGIEY